MKITFGKRQHTITVPRRVGLALAINLGYLDAMKRSGGHDEAEIRDRLLFCLGQADILEAAGLIDQKVYALFTDEIYRIYHGEGSFTYEDEYSFS
jgi:hypothetical protein